MIIFFQTNIRKQLKLLKDQVDIYNTHIKEASEFIAGIEKGNFHLNISEKLLGSPIGSALASMKEHLLKIAEDEQQRSWSNTGLAKFSDILRNKQSLTLENLADDILQSLVKYVNANQGALFILEDEGTNQSYLEMIACYAYNRKKFLNKKILPGEGLAGQCLLEKQPIYLKEIPSDYVNITSGLGEATPKSILISPLLINEKVFGVIELASFKEFQSYQIDFINKLTENIAATINNVKESEKTLSLLNASQQQAEELRSQEEELRQHMEEMQATQEEMRRQSDDINSATAEMKGILDGINATMATIEFTPDGTIVAANDNFLRTMKCTIDQIRNNHHRIFVPPDVLETIEYKTFWNKLAAGESITGVFKRRSFKGDIVWLNAIYNPIRNAHDKVEKVIKFATDITVEQERSAENKGILNAINSTMAVIEFLPDGTIVTANDNFLKTMKCSLDEIKGKHHKIFVSAETKNGEEYKTFWARLSAGESITGKFKRISTKGENVWLNAIYNPIVSADGRVVKVVKFATDITAEQEMLAESQGVVKGIDATMATITFKPDGTILNANQNFMKAVEYSLTDIVGKHHQMFVPQDVQETPDYKSFWLRLSAGESITGTFKRVSSTGKTIWLNAIYNPIFNANGDVAKVIKFATDITSEREMLAEGEGLLKGIDYSMTTIEFKPNGTIIKANANFLKAMNCSLEDIQGKHHRIFVPDAVQKSKEYENFWSRLAKGEPMTGVFERVTADGKPVLLNAIYNPIVSANNEVNKIVKFATIVNT